LSVVPATCNLQQTTHNSQQTTHNRQQPIMKTAFWFYNLGWKIAIPLLRKNPRLAEGFEQRIFQEKMPEKADLWIQAASGGESYLARTLLENLSPARPINILLTSNTRQGMDILADAVRDIRSERMRAYAAYFPFDKPENMSRVVRHVCPKVMVLLESEIWPGLLSALKSNNCKILIINGRMTEKSLRRYRLWLSFWYALRPDKVLAISEKDAERFAALFGKETVSVMSNIKFDRFDAAARAENPLEKILITENPFLVLGSTGDKEEPFIEKMILRILDKQPDTLIGLFPRHMYRIPHWKAVLENLSVPWILRSEISAQNCMPVSAGTVILWDVFGELAQAYQLSKAAFVGGSLIPFGGQNFLEPLICGVVPVIGPYWGNFFWIGKEIEAEGLLKIAGNWKSAADMLLAHIENSSSRETVRKAALQYIKDRQGGAATAGRIVSESLNHISPAGTFENSPAIHCRESRAEN
jgi:3-deoxy-D-manno-octulosonic-acid transferase